ncbi:DUF4783 domain-containing protein [Sediminibacterium soli]|uniref:DUF4783 domain-containing protein n=1 Tax=Sediminibacterium soli TaxID=2698829 RepID=UPI00137B038E|nr:DUF4783 domain-containing protein [Sediminibacterium soli]NCI45454.1 DUF4783 domain-containing protein [Sediminibacterium soli]
MKKICLLIAMAMGFLSFTPQSDTEVIVQAFKSGNATEVSKYFDDYIDIKLLDKAEVKNLSRNQGSIMLKSFFDENTIKGFDKASEREVGNTMYMTGKLNGTGKSFGVTILLKAKDGKHQIISVRIS